MKTECYYYNCHKSGKVIGTINNTIKVAYCKDHIEKGTKLFDSLIVPDNWYFPLKRSQHLKDAAKQWDADNLKLPSWYIKPNWNQRKNRIQCKKEYKG